jgi:DNA-binding protein HU-beta
MNKQELLAKIAEESGLNKTKVESVLKSLAATAKDEVVTKGEFTLQDICKIKTSIRKAGERRNPGTGQVFHSPEKKVVKITPAKFLRDAVL